MEVKLGRDMFAADVPPLLVSGDFDAQRGWAGLAPRLQAAWGNFLARFARYRGLIAPAYPESVLILQANQSLSIDSTARKASCGISTLPTAFIRFLPSFCFSSSLRLREMSPP